MDGRSRQARRERECPAIWGRCDKNIFCLVWGLDCEMMRELDDREAPDINYGHTGNMPPAL
jgi:hypothetical protein